MAAFTAPREGGGIGLPPPPTGGGGGGVDWGSAGLLGQLFDFRWFGGQAETQDAWDTYNGAFKALAALGWSDARARAEWKAGGSRKQRIRYLAKTVYMYGAFKAGKKVREAGDWFRRFPELLRAVEAILGPLLAPAPATRPGRIWSRGRVEAMQPKFRDVLGPRPPPAPAPAPPAPAALPDWRWWLYDAARVYSTIPRDPSQRAPGTVQQSALDEWLRIIELVRGWWLAREQAKQDEREARRIRRAQEAEAMALGDIIGSVSTGITSALQAATPLVSAIYAERAARSARRAGVGGSASGVPLGIEYESGAYGTPILGARFAPSTLTGPLMRGAATGALGALLGGEPGAMEEGGLLEGLESEIEREAVLWTRPSGIGGRVTPVRTVYARHPQSGAIRAWGYLGSPVLYSGDLATCKRVNRIARRAAGRVGLRFRTARRRR